MKFLTKAALGALMLAGAATITAAPAQARVSVGVAIGGGYYDSGYYGRPAYCDPYSRWYDPYRCDDRYDDNYDYYDGPVFIDGLWRVHRLVALLNKGFVAPAAWQSPAG